MAGPASTVIVCPQRRHLYCLPAAQSRAGAPCSHQRQRDCQRNAYARWYACASSMMRRRPAGPRWNQIRCRNQYMVTAFN
jgi:hypothetical protein